MRSPVQAHLNDDELFSEILRARAAGEDVGRALGELCERWRKPAGHVIRKIQASYGVRSPDDEDDLFQEAVGKLVDKGLDQFRGVSERMVGQAAHPRTFFLRITKHVAIDRYRRRREELARTYGDDDDDAPDDAPAQVAEAVERSRASEQAAEASELYWQAFSRLQEEHPNEAAAWDLYHHQDVEDHEECAERLEITVTNSYKRVSRAQAYLKLYLMELREREDMS
jgi:RNA polymerase sigma-70 factor (ECF subfamily)